MANEETTTEEDLSAAGPDFVDLRDCKTLDRHYFGRLLLVDAVYVGSTCPKCHDEAVPTGDHGNTKFDVFWDAPHGCHPKLVRLFIPEITCRT